MRTPLAFAVDGSRRTISLSPPPRVDLWHGAHKSRVASAQEGLRRRFSPVSISHAWDGGLDFFVVLNGLVGPAPPARRVSAVVPCPTNMNSRCGHSRRTSGAAGW